MRFSHVTTTLQMALDQTTCLVLWDELEHRCGNQKANFSYGFVGSANAGLGQKLGDQGYFYMEW